MECISEKIYEQAVNLPIDKRLMLIDKLLISTNLPIQNDIDLVWSAEVERRSQAIDRGEAKLISGDAVFKKIRKRLSK